MQDLDNGLHHFQQGGEARGGVNIPDGNQQQDRSCMVRYDLNGVARHGIWIGIGDVGIGIGIAGTSKTHFHVSFITHSILTMDHVL